jgi:hypothetical protein
MHSEPCQNAFNAVLRMGGSLLESLPLLPGILYQVALGWLQHLHMLGLGQSQLATTSFAIVHTWF